MERNNLVNKVGVFSLIALLTIAILYLYKPLHTIIYSYPYLIITILSVLIVSFILLKLKLILPKWINIVIITIFLLFAANMGYELYKEQTNSKLTDSQKRNIQFIELFYAIEIDPSVENINSSANDNEEYYIDYIINKYALWKKENIANYNNMKKHLSTDYEEWKKLLLSAQKYKRNTKWKAKLKEIEDKTIEQYTNSIENTNPDLYKYLIETDEILSIENKEDAKRLYKTIFPNKPFVYDKWEENLKHIKKEIENSSTLWTRKIIREKLRELFREEYQRNLL